MQSFNLFLGKKQFKRPDILSQHGGVLETQTQRMEELCYYCKLLLNNLFFSVSGHVDLPVHGTELSFLKLVSLRDIKEGIINALKTGDSAEMLKIATGSE